MTPALLLLNLSPMPVAAASVPHEPLSQRLAQIIAAEADHLTANRLLARTQGRGLFLVITLLALPFVAWLSIPGMSTVLGLMIALLASQLVLNQPAHLPRFLGDRKLPPRLRAVVLTGGLKFCRQLEKVVRPRRTVWLGWRLAHIINALLITVNALCLALPLPAPPFFGSNAIPCYAIILLAVSTMEEDGVMIWFAYLASAISIAYFALFGALIFKHIGTWCRTILHWLGVNS